MNSDNIIEIKKDMVISVLGKHPAKVLWATVNDLSAPGQDNEICFQFYIEFIPPVEGTAGFFVTLPQKDYTPRQLINELLKGAGEELAEHMKKRREAMQKQAKRYALVERAERTLIDIINKL